MPSFVSRLAAADASLRVTPATSARSYGSMMVSLLARMTRWPMAWRFGGIDPTRTPEELMP